MSHPAAEASEDPFSPGKQSVISGEQSSSDMASGSSKNNSDREANPREARRSAFRRSIGTGAQLHDQVFYDTTPDEVALPAHGGIGAIEGDESDHEEDSKEVSEVEGADQEDDADDHEENYTPTPAYDGWSSEPPSGSMNDGDDDNFAARLTVALENVAENDASSSDVEIADSETGSDDAAMAAVNDIITSIEREVADSYADSDFNSPENAVQSIEKEIANSQAGSDDPDNNVDGAASSSDEEVPDSQADSNDLQVHSDNTDDESDTIAVHHRTRELARLAPVRVAPPRHCSNNDPDNDPDSDFFSGSSLSDLENTPEPADPELTRLDRVYRRRNIRFCSCLGCWCECSRYSTFYGSEATREGGVDEEVKQEKAKPWVMPSPTHLNEATLANERLPTSATRSTIVAHRRFEERVVAFSWDRQKRPARAPVGWVGEEWWEFLGGYKRATVEEVSDAGD